MSKRRKYDMKNKRSFIVIIILSILVIGIFSLFIYRYIKTAKIEYVVDAETVLQDVDKNYLTLDDDGILRVRWDNTYYLDYLDERITLGKKIVAYNSVANEVRLYGSFYEIQSDGKIIENKNETKLSNVSDTKFYKIDDREYLLVDSKITSEDDAIEAYNYLLVELDKAGNAKLSNNKLNLKTITPTVLVTSKYKFDIANEKLYFDELEIDLKKIIGSTNQYVPEEENTDDNNDDDNNSINSGNNNPGNNQIVGGGSGNLVTPDDVINNSKPGDVIDMDDVLSKLKMTSILRIVEGITTIDIDYVIYDPYNEYGMVNVLVSPITSDGYVDTVNGNSYEIDKSKSHITLYGLTANTKYNLEFTYEITKTNEETNITEIITEKFEDGPYTVRTKSPKYGITVYRVSQYQNSITFQIELEKNYKIKTINGSIDMGDDVNSNIPFSVPVSQADIDRGYIRYTKRDVLIKSDSLIKLRILNVVDEFDKIIDIKESYSFKLYGEEATD